MREAVALLQTVAGDHRLTEIRMRTTLAKLLGLRGRPREALAQHQRIQRDRSALLGADHPDAAVDWNNLGNTYLSLDRCAEAEQAYQRAKVLVVRGLGPDHPRTVWVLVGLAYARDCAGHYAQAETDFAETERMLLKTLSWEHPIALSLHGGRGTSQYRQGNPAAAESFYLQALTLARKLQSPSTARIEGHLGTALLAQGRNAEAETRLAAALAEMGKNERAATDPIKLRFEAAHGLALFLTGRRETGTRKLRVALAALEAAGETASENYAESAGDMAALLEARGDAAEARDWRQRAHSAFARTFGPGHPLSLRAALPPDAGR
jgi:tetratricopeptide (TPR) repeat protein